MTVCAKETFAFYTPDGAQVVVHRGRPFPDGHPYIKGREHLFEPADVVAARSAALTGVTGAAAAVETATASPGERRSVTRKSSGSSGSSSRFAEEESP